MTAPTGAEIAIYGAKAKTHDYRVIVGFTERQWTAIFSETFDAEPSPSNWRSTQWGGSSVPVSGGRALFRAYGGPPREELITREHAFPTDPTKAFKVTIVVAFSQSNPVYSQVLAVGAIEQLFGIEGNPLMVVQQGSADTADGGLIGNIAVQSMGSIVEVVAYTASDLTFVVEWDPDAPGGAGNEMLTIRRNGTIVAESSDDGFAVAPRFVQLGYVRGSSRALPDDNPAAVTDIVTPLGTSGVPVTTMSVASVTVEEDGNGYETATYPAWTSANAGGAVTGGDWTTLSAAAGERFTESGVTWAILPQKFIKAGGGWGPSRLGVRTPNLTLSLAGGDSGDYELERWIGRTVLIDSRVKNDAGTAAAWKRLAVLTVEDIPREDDDGIQLALIERIPGRFDVPMARSYIGEEGDGDALGEIEATNRLFSIPEIMEDLLDVADTHAGGLLPTSDRRVNMPVIIPSILDSGGASLLTVARGLCERLVQQMWQRNRMSGWGVFGGLMVNVWDFGLGTSSWTFYGRGGTAGGSMVQPPGFILKRSGRSASQVFYRQDNPLLFGELRGLANAPLVGTFPSGAFPSVGRELDDSLATASNSDGFSVLQPFPSDDDDAIDRLGGPPFLRYWKELLSRRTVSFSIAGHNWMEPGDEIALADSEGRGLTTAETWVIDQVTYTLDKGELKATVEATTTSRQKAFASTV